MIIAVIEDGTIEVVEDLAEARRNYEPIDVESDVIVFYAEDGTWLKPVFTKPNRYRFFGFVLEQGEYDLAPDPNLDSTVDPFDVALAESVALEPNPYFASLDELRAHVNTQRNRS